MRRRATCTRLHSQRPNSNAGTTAAAVHYIEHQCGHPHVGVQRNNTLESRHHTISKRTRNRRATHRQTACHACLTAPPRDSYISISAVRSMSNASALNNNDRVTQRRCTGWHAGAHGHAPAVARQHAGAYQSRNRRACRTREMQQQQLLQRLSSLRLLSCRLQRLK